MAETKKIVKDLGEVTAYAYAVSKGYTGTEEEFATLMASYATVGQQTADAKNAAVTARNEAEAAKNESVAAKDEAVQAAGDAAKDAKDTIDQILSDVRDNIEQIDQNTLDIADLKETTEDLEDRKANIDGSYPDMTVGNAEQLNSSKYVENSEPYTLRTSGGTSDIGNREYLDAVVGGTLAWNQAVRDEASENQTDFADIVTVTDAVEDAAGVKVKIEPVQDLHGYDHPWPAGGGKNLFDGILERGNLQPDNTNPLYARSANFIPVDGDTTYTFLFADVPTLDASTGQVYTLEYDSNKQYIDNTRKARKYGLTSGDSTVFTTVATAKYVRFFVYDTVEHPLTDWKKIQIEEGSTATAYEPYSNICPITGWDGVHIVVSPTTDAADGQTYSITLPTEAGTVYGGELTVNEDGSGSLVVDRASVDLGTLNYSEYGSSDTVTQYYTVNLDMLAKDYSRIVSDVFVDSTILAPWTGRMTRPQGKTYLRTPKDQYSSPANFKSAMSGVQLVYELATPITYTLTASEIRTLLGTNNVWADTGDVALTYTGTDEHLTLESGRKYLARLSGTDSMLLGSGQEITAAKGTDNVFDLTQMFGTAVADYLYNLEQATAGAGVALFRSWFPKEYYEYNPGELRHVEGLSAHEMVGFNAWDEEWELGSIKTQDGKNTSSTQKIRSKNFIPCIPSTRYGIYYSNYGADVDYVYFYDSDQQFIGYKIYRTNNAGTTGTYIFETLENCRYIRFIIKATSYHGGLCVHLAHNGSRNGEYEPYEKHSYPLDSTVVLRGIPKVGANGVYWDGDRYLPDGTVERRYVAKVLTGAVDERWQVYATSTICNRFALLLPDRIPTADSTAVDTTFIVYGMTTISKNMTGSAAAIGKVSGWDRGGTGLIFNLDPSVSLEQFKASLAENPLYLVYELAMPTTETAQPYHSTQWVSDWGTEEFVSTGVVPVGTETRYPANLRDKLQHLPDAASGNGSYLITQTDGQMVLTPFPAPPSTAGNYVLKATVTGGVATYTWEVAT